MAVTKIWAVTDSVSRVLSYAANPSKTIYNDICKALHYASDERKTVAGEEKAMYVTGVNCSAKSAFAEMTSVQERFDKTTGNVAYHAYQSFKTGEVTPELAHKLGVELAKRMWGDEYQVLVATHFNTGTYHNHLVINSVNMWNGKKFNCNEGAYWKLRSISDELCKENGLTVIKNPSGKTPRKLYFAEKNGEPTQYNLMREAIDRALEMSTNPKTFTYVMKRLGYVVDLNSYHKYATVRSVNSKKATRLYRLGEDYDHDAIYDRMRETLQNNPQKAYRLYSEFTAKKSFGVTIQKACFVKGSLKNAKKITGLKALYFKYLYLLGVLPKNKKHKPLSTEMREACRFFNRYSEQVQLICDNRLTDISSVEAYIKTAESEMKLISDYRKMLYREIKSCHDPTEKAKLVAKRDDCTKALAKLRKDKKTATRIIEDNPKIKENISIEENMRNQYLELNKQRKMTKRNTDFTLPMWSFDDLFSTQEQRDDEKLERVQNIPLSDLHPFKDHPFKVQNNEEMKRMIESIKKVGAITPAVARPLENGYEIISGHRRLAAYQELGLETMPVIVRDMTDDEAVIAMVDANLQRETVLPSEKAFAYKMKLDAIKHQGKTSVQVAEKLLSVEKVAEDAGESRDQVRGYIRLTYLIPDFNA